MASDFGVPLRLVVGIDASAGKSMMERQGLGKAKHIDTQYLWCQDLIGSGHVCLEKVPGERNTADLMTKHLTGPKMLDLLGRLGHHLVGPTLPGPSDRTDP